VVYVRPPLPEFGELSELSEDGVRLEESSHWPACLEPDDAPDRRSCSDGQKTDSCPIAKLRSM